MRKLLSLLFFITFLAFMLVIGSYNKTPVNVHFLVVQSQWPLAVVMAMMLFCGFIFGLIGALVVGASKSKQGAHAVKDTEQASQPDLSQSTQEQQLLSNPTANSELIADKVKS